MSPEVRKEIERLLARIRKAHRGFFDAEAAQEEDALMAYLESLLSGEAVAWMWNYVGKDPMRENIKPVARSVREMDPSKPPYPDTWQPVAPLYLHPAAPSAANPWKEAVLDELALACMDARMDEEPRSILKRVIAWNVMVALDPAVSSEAQALIDRGAAQAAPSAAAPSQLPHPGSPEASAMIDSLLAEYQWPANSKNAARAGYEAARRMLSAPAQPVQGMSDAEKALRELVRLKNMLDNRMDYDERVEFQNAWPAAWTNARALLSTQGVQQEVK